MAALILVFSIFAVLALFGALTVALAWCVLERRPFSFLLLAALTIVVVLFSALGLSTL